MEEIVVKCIVLRKAQGEVGDGRGKIHHGLVKVGANVKCVIARGR